MSALSFTAAWISHWKKWKQNLPMCKRLCLCFLSGVKRHIIALKISCKHGNLTAF